jgi:hypothetical protein
MKPSSLVVGARPDLRLAATLALGLMLLAAWVMAGPALPEPQWLQAQQQVC